MQQYLDYCISKGWFGSALAAKALLPIQAIEVGTNVVASIADHVQSLDMGKTLAVVSDENTHAVCGEAVEQMLTSQATIVSIVFTDGPVADSKTVDQLQKAIHMADGVVAVGSGTLNDICKYASFLERKPYCVVGTAPSMNGYASGNAAILDGEYKKSVVAQLPKGIFLDLDMLSQAPARLVKSGVGDLLCRSTAQADWILSHYLKGGYYSNVPFELLMPLEKPLFESVEALLEGSLEAMELLCHSLLLSGIGMGLCGGSYPASQGEHLIAHTMEMVHGRQLPVTYHGEQIGVTTLTMHAIQSGLMETTPVLTAKEGEDAEIIEYFGDTLGKEAIEAIAGKRITAAMLDDFNHHISSQWPVILDEIASIYMPVERIQGVLEALEAPTSPAGLGWDECWYQQAVSHAWAMRDRFTFLDLKHYSAV